MRVAKLFYPDRRYGSTIEGLWRICCGCERIVVSSHVGATSPLYLRDEVCRYRCSESTTSEIIRCLFAQQFHVYSNRTTGCMYIPTVLTHCCYYPVESSSGCKVVLPVKRQNSRIYLDPVRWIMLTKNFELDPVLSG